MDEKIIQSITTTNFDELTFESITPVIALFSAKRCNICRLLYPVIETLAVEYTKKKYM